MSNRFKKEEKNRGKPFGERVVSYTEFKRLKESGEDFGIVSVKFETNNEWAEYLSDVEFGKHPLGDKNLPPLPKKDS
jgi:hypothetical protein